MCVPVCVCLCVCGELGELRRDGALTSLSVQISLVLLSFSVAVPLWFGSVCTVLLGLKANMSPQRIVCVRACVL